MRESHSPAHAGQEKPLTQAGAGKECVQPEAIESRLCQDFRVCEVLFIMYMVVNTC